MRLLDRYVLKNFLVPFLLCFFGFLAIWLVFDLTDNMPDFLEAKKSLSFVAYFYAMQVPAVVMLSLPVGLLLSLLYALSRMSRTNEIISMLTAGQSVTRVLMPLMVFGLLATGVCTALNYKLAPHAEALRKVLMAAVHGKERDGTVGSQLFRNRADDRTWYVQRLPAKSNELLGIHVVQQDEKGDIIRKYYARRAKFDPVTKIWSFVRGKLVNFDSEGNITGEELFLAGEYKVEGWSETPWRIASTNLEAQNLSIPELQDYLRFNADFPDTQLAPYRTHLNYRWALPWSCFIVVFIAAPLGIVYSRRGVLTGVAAAISLFFIMIFLTNLFLALGKGARIPAAFAAWSPTVLFGLIGLFLLRLRASNRELPRFTFTRTTK